MKHNPATLGYDTVIYSKAVFHQKQSEESDTIHHLLKYIAELLKKLAF